ncbi:NAD-dependent epimerase/dehydratase family protein [Aeromicrobium wangtongii]|uniref:NAD-dependent epimerase/dehydratase family protein n=1 Tax=Aeromicrobium wangtongii TaxID=2969247 RepID=A0ABY5MBG3_9ACTN|nr:NAD-dependent epimerase/dehydratase family protein [Aeromicrobium wangtongii]MCD9196983.1 NAD-dependent epimerase/dehydratase family protein [Aeromicrobium wangtongii]UUP14484.1 NAD-dependent epimerase/dehydratase family protein [Aeromicrobium wangtongii]
MRVFVVGANGYVGRHVARAFSAAGLSVLGSVRKNAAQLSEELPGVVLRQMPEVDELAVRRIVAESDAVVIAAQLNLQEENELYRRFIAAMDGSGKTLIMISGTSVLTIRSGGAEDSRRFAEDDPFSPLPWLIGRVDTENDVRTSAARGVRAMVIRPPLIFGNGGSTQIPLLFESVRKTGFACYVGEGLNRYSYVHVEDLAELVVAAVARGTAGALYHASVGDIPSFRHLAELIAQRFGCQTRSLTLDEATQLWGKFSAHVGLGGNSRTLAPRAMRDLGWEPRRLDISSDVLAGPYA